MFCYIYKERVFVKYVFKCVFVCVRVFYMLRHSPGHTQIYALLLDIVPKKFTFIAVNNENKHSIDDSR